MAQSKIEADIEAVAEADAEADAEVDAENVKIGHNEGEAMFEEQDLYSEIDR